ncbi:MAG: DUF4199 domain-containing protein [Saprospiraceae bacterium]|nr:DUF4199 domain-containing protein [Saprospiraceae bacterium]MCB9325767.1 DUF4199 domain-containing protein [Lewinellaceae bacterium]
MSNVLDTPPSTDPSSVSYMQTVLRYGVIGAMITIIFGLIGNLTGLSSPCNGIAMTAIFGLVSIVIYIGVLVYGIRKHRDDELGGYISFGRAFLVGFLIAIIMTIIGQIFNYVYFNYIDSELLSNSMDCIREMYEKMGMDEATIEEAMSKAGDQMDKQKSLVGALPMALGINAVVAAIVGLIMKKSVPETM